jgi:uncharacterized protein
LCATQKGTEQTSGSIVKNYPNIAQSFGISGMLILGLILFSPVAIMLRKLIGNEASFLIYYLLAVGTTFWIIYIIKKKKTGNISFNITIENKRVIPFVIVGTIFLYCGIVSPISALIPMSESAKEAFINTGSQIGILTFFQTVIVAPILEELIFCGIILDGLLKKYSPAKSIFIYSFLFGLIHLNPSQFVFGLIIGAFSGWVYYRTRSITFSILIHAVANLASVLMRYFLISDSLKDNILLGMYGEISNLIFAVVGSLLIVIICIYFLMKEFNKTEIEMAAHNTRYN